MKRKLRISLFAISFVAVAAFFSQAIFPYDEYRAIYLARRVPVDSLDCYQSNVLKHYPVIGDSWHMQVGRGHYMGASHLMGCKVHVDESLNRFWASTDATVLRVEGNGLVRVVGPGRARVYFDKIAAGGQNRVENVMLSTPVLPVFTDSARYALIADQTEIGVGALLEPAQFRITDSWADTTVYAVVTPWETECFDRVDHQTPTSSIGWRLKQCVADTVHAKYTYGAGLREDRALRVLK